MSIEISKILFLSKFFLSKHLQKNERWKMVQFYYLVILFYTLSSYKPHQNSFNLDTWIRYQDF